MNVIVVVLNYNGTEDTRACVRSLERAGVDPGRILVVDNGSRPPLRVELGGERLPGRIVEIERNRGYTGGINFGARAAMAEGADAVFLLTNDTEATPGFLDALVRAMETSPETGVVVPKILLPGPEPILWAHGARVDRWTGRSPHIGVLEADRGQHDHVRDVERVTGCALLVRRRVLETVGLLDERFYMYAEDTDWSLRIRRAGWRLAVAPESVVRHRGHGSMKTEGKARVLRLRTRNHLLLLRKHSGYFVAGGAVALAWFVLSATRQALAGLLGRDRARVAAVVRGVEDFCLGRFGPPRP